MSEILISIRDNEGGETARIEISTNPALVVFEPKTPAENIAVALITRLIELNPEVFSKTVQINKGFGDQVSRDN